MGLAFDKKEAVIAIQSYLNNGSQDDIVLNAIDKTIEVVFHKHYPSSSAYLEDIRSEVYCKIFKVLSSYDPSKDIFNFLYSTVRNSFHNFLYHVGKQSVEVELESNEHHLAYDEDLDDINLTLRILHKSFSNYKLGEDILQYFDLLKQLKEAATDENMFDTEEKIHQFATFYFFKMKSSVLLQLLGYFILFKEKDFKSLLIVLCSFYNQLPQSKTLMKTIIEYNLFLNSKVEIEKGNVPKEFHQWRDSLAEYEIALKDVFNYIEGKKRVNLQIFEKEIEYI